MSKKQNPGQIEKSTSYKITDKCLFCYTCVELCPNSAIKKSYPLFTIDENLCDNCGLCYEVCRHGAIKKVH